MKAHSIRALIYALLLVGVATFATGCSESTSPTVDVDDACSGERVDYDDESYCVFIEEGFLTEDCPEDFPNGIEIDEAVVCAQGSGEAPEGLRDELERRGLIDGGAACSDDNDCRGFGLIAPPQCEGDILVAYSYRNYCGEDNTCQSEDTTTRTDCAAQGQVCREGACVDDAPLECRTNDDCPVPDQAPPRCEGDDVVWETFNIFCDERGMCQGEGSVQRESCTEQGLVCQDGACVREGGEECRADEECPQPDAPLPYCDGSVSVIASPEGYCDERGQCQIDANEARQDCADQGLICEEGFCVREGGDMCRTDDECPTPPGLPPMCDGDVVVAEFAEGFCNADNMCDIRGESFREDCAAAGLVCLDGACVEGGGEECRTNEECPTPDAAPPQCDGDVLFGSNPVGYCGQDNTCQIDANPFEIDCAEQGQVCRDGACVDDGGQECRTNEECPQPVPAPPRCEGNGVYSATPVGYCGQDNTCQIDLNERFEDCGIQGLVCRDGECVEGEPGPECRTNEECPQPPGLPPRCEGDVVVEEIVTPFCGQDNTCEVATEVRTTECAAEGLVCRDGQCEPPGPGCTDNDDCPVVDPPPPFCEGDTVVYSSARSYCDQDGQCAFDDAQTRVDCTDEGLVCREGMCIEDRPGPECTRNEECPVVDPPPPSCEGDTVIFTNVFSYCGQDNTCQIDSDETQIDCAAEGLVCREGMCIEDRPGPECTRNEECPQPDAPMPYCDGEVAVTGAPVGYCGQDGVCVIDANETRDDCAAQGLACVEGMCTRP